MKTVLFLLASLIPVQTFRATCDDDHVCIVKEADLDALTERNRELVLEIQALKAKIVQNCRIHNT